MHIVWKETPDSGNLGAFVLICAGIIALSGIGTAVIAARGLSVTGLVERVNIFTLQLMVLALSLWFYFRTFRVPS